MCQFWKYSGYGFTPTLPLSPGSFDGDALVMYVTAFPAFLTHMGEHHHKEWA